MAKIFHTALVSSIHKKMHGSILRRRKGHTLLSQGQRPRDPHSARQMQLRGHFNYLAGKWGALTPTQQEMWNTHASRLDKPMSGFNDFVGMNTRLLAASNSTLVIRDTPPATPDTPTYSTDFSVLFISNSTNLLSWTEPDSASLFLSIYRSVEPGFSYTKKRRWSLVATVRSDDKLYSDTHGFPQGVPIRYHARVIDPYGRQSPRTAAVPTIVSPMAFIVDTENFRIKEYTIDPLSFSRMFGTAGSGETQFNEPNHIAADQAYLYISDYGNSRVKKHLRGNFSFTGSITSLSEPTGIDCDDTYLVFIEYAVKKIRLFNKETLAPLDSQTVSHWSNGCHIYDGKLYVATGGSYQIFSYTFPGLSLVTDWTFANDSIIDITSGGGFLWATSYSQNRLLKIDPSTGSLVDTYGSFGSGDDNFSGPYGIDYYDGILYVVDYWNNRIKKHRASDWTFIEASGSTGSGQGQFSSPQGIAVA